MSPGRTKSIALSLTILVASLGLGCGSELRDKLAPNQAPEVHLTTPLAVSTDQQAVAYAMSWKAEDRDGRVDHYLYAIDPASVDRVDESWTMTRLASANLHFARRTELGRAAPVSGRPRADFHVFAVRAVDDRGAQSPTATLALFEDNVAPLVFIENPVPGAIFTPITTTSPTITWRGIDPDGQVVRYKYRLFTASNPDFPGIPNFLSLVAQNPDTLRALYAPGFAGWDSSGPGNPSVHYSGLAPNQLYLFAIIAIDNRGAYTPLFDATSNLLRFAVAEGLGPLICLTSPSFNFCQSFPNDPAPTIEVQAGASIPVSWFGVPPQGTDIEAYRYAVDPAEPLDDSRRTWTVWSLQTTSTALGPYASGEQHLLVVQARDKNGLVGTVRQPLVVIAPPELNKDLLVVDDTRLFPDQLTNGGVVGPPRGPWPTAAELDTFLYARGGFPWRGYPEGTLSRTGILAGYSFDTLGTRGVANGIVPLSVLNRYRHVIWMTDDVGATYNGSPQDPVAPITSLRLMSSPGQQSTLAAYMAGGGKLWLQGGGAAYATLVAWNRRNNPPDEFTDPELVAGRFMYDFAHWRSGIRVGVAQQAFLNVPQIVGDPTAAPGRGWPGQPDYQKLAARDLFLVGRTCASDPPPPLRNCDSFYLPSLYPSEYLFQPNAVVEDADPRPNHENFVSVLDTLYVAIGGTTTPRMPVMTYYHGSEGGPVVFSGFPIWFFQRQQGADLTDFVLRDIWGLSKTAGVGQVSVRVARRR
jgi:hypothetical protein